MLRNFRLPRRQVRVSDGRGALDTDTQRQRVLVLPGKRNQVSIA